MKADKAGSDRRFSIKAKLGLDTTKIKRWTFATLNRDVENLECVVEDTFERRFPRRLDHGCLAGRDRVAQRLVLA